MDIWIYAGWTAFSQKMMCSFCPRLSDEFAFSLSSLLPPCWLNNSVQQFNNVQWRKENGRKLPKNGLAKKMKEAEGKGGKGIAQSTSLPQPINQQNNPPLIFYVCLFSHPSKNGQMRSQK
jgi:hypothetical protein